MIHLTPDDFNSFDAALKSDKSLLLGPGDFRHWGSINALNGFNDIRVVSNDGAICSNFNVRLSDRAYFEGITFSGQFGSSMIISNENRVVNCRFIDIGDELNSGALSIIQIDRGSRNVFENCYFRQASPSLMRDGSGINIRGEMDKPSVGNIIRLCWFENLNDAIQLNVHCDEYGQGRFIGPVDGTIIKGNRFLISSDFYNEKGDAIFAENAIDIKARAIDDPVDISENLFIGYRPTDKSGGSSGGGGDAITIHVHGEKINIRSNTFFDCYKGISIRSNPNKYGRETGDVIIQDNFFNQIERQAVEIWRAKSIQLNGNFFDRVGSKFLIDDPINLLERRSFEINKLIL